MATNSLDAAVRFDHVDPNDDCDRLLNDLIDQLNRSARVIINSSDSSLSLVWTGIQEPQGAVRGVPWERDGELWTLQGGEYHPAYGMGTYGMAMLMHCDHLDRLPVDDGGRTVPWRRREGMRMCITADDGTTTEGEMALKDDDGGEYCVVEWVGYPSPWANA